LVNGKFAITRNKRVISQYVLILEVMWYTINLLSSHMQRGYEMTQALTTISASQAQSFASVLCLYRIKSFAQSHPDYPAFAEEERKRQEREQNDAANVKRRISRKQKETLPHHQSC